MSRLSIWSVLAMMALVAGASAAGPFDGSYTGSRRETVNNNSGFCQNVTNNNAHLAIIDSVIKYQWGPVPLETTVASDGSFSVDRTGGQSRGSSAVVSLKGRISGKNLEADVGGSSCAAHLSLKKA